MSILILSSALGAVSARSAYAEQVEPPLRLAKQHARAWLMEQQSEDGSFGQRVPWRDTDLALEALERLDETNTDRLASWLETAPANIDFLSRRIAISASLGADTTSDTALLMAAQQDDGGFPLSASYSSDVLDTALALRALAANSDQETEERRAVEYLLSAANSDGGWSYTVGGPSDIGLTASIVRLLVPHVQSQWPVVGLADSVDAAGTWLLSQRAGDENWGTFADTALACIALRDSGVTFDESSTVGWLLARQGPDGSFGRGDVRDTALAVQALRPADRNVSVTHVIVSDSAPRQGGVVRVTAIVANDGEADLDAFEVGMTASSGGAQQDLSTFAVPGLEAGTSTTVSYNFDTREASGTVSFTAEASPIGTVFETNSADNSRSTSILVRTAPLAPFHIAPGEEALFGATSPFFAWLSPAGADEDAFTYELQLDRRTSFDSSYVCSYAVPGDPGVMVSYQIPADVQLGDGTWFWRVRATETGFHGPWSSRGSFIVDRTPPVMSGLSSTPGLFSPNDDGRRDLHRATFQVSEPCIGTVEVLSASGQILGVAQSGISLSAGHVSFEWDGTLVGSGDRLADGTYRLRISASDEAGNATSTTTGLVTLDTTPPSFLGLSSSVSSISPNGDGYYDKATYSWSTSSDALVTVRVIDSLGKGMSCRRHAGRRRLPRSVRECTSLGVRPPARNRLPKSSTCGPVSVVRSRLPSTLEEVPPRPRAEMAGYTSSAVPTVGRLVKCTTQSRIRGRRSRFRPRATTQWRSPAPTGASTWLGEAAHARQWRLSIRQL